MTKRIGPRMAELAAIVSAVPGISCREALWRAGLPERGVNPFAPVHRAARAGLVVIEAERSNRYRLFATERDRQRYYLRGELLEPGTPADRITEIRAELERLDAERANTWRAS